MAQAPPSRPSAASCGGYPAVTDATHCSLLWEVKLTASATSIISAAKVPRHNAKSAKGTSSGCADALARRPSSQCARALGCNRHRPPRWEDPQAPTEAQEPRPTTLELETQLRPTNFITAARRKLPVFSRNKQHVHVTVGVSQLLYFLISSLIRATMFNFSPVRNVSWWWATAKLAKQYYSKMLAI